MTTIANANRQIIANPCSIVFIKTTYTPGAIGRLLRAIRIYCYHTVYRRNLDEKECIVEYLNQTLKGQELLIWNRLRPQERAAFIVNQDSLIVDPLSLRQYNLLLQQYKREGNAYYRFWKQAQTTIRVELGVKISQK